MHRFLGSLFGVGFLPGAPGTYASVLAVVAYYIGSRCQAPVWSWPICALVFSALALVVGVPRGAGDPGWFVLDEVAGTFLSLSLLPVDSPLLSALFALVFFRFFDIVKPPPVNWAERIPGTTGVLADDLVAGLFANILSRVLLWIVH